MHEKERFVQRGGVFGLDDVVGDFDASGVESLREIADMIRTQAARRRPQRDGARGQRRAVEVPAVPGRLRLLRARAHRGADPRGRRRGAGRDHDRERRADLHQPAPAVRGDEARPVPRAVQPRRGAGLPGIAHQLGPDGDRRPRRQGRRRDRRGLPAAHARGRHGPGFRQAGLGLRRPRATTAWCRCRR